MGKQSVVLEQNSARFPLHSSARFLVRAACLVVRSPERLHLVLGEGGWSHHPLISSCGAHGDFSAKQTRHPELGGSQGPRKDAFLQQLLAALALTWEKTKMGAWLVQSLSGL